MSEKSTPVIDIQNVTIELGGQLILKDVNLKIFEGETVVLVGPSGEGKSVLLKTMAGLFVPKAGRVCIEGRPWQELTQGERRAQAKKIGMLFQKGALYDSETCLENIMFPMVEHMDWSRKHMLEKAQSLLDAVGLDEASQKLPHELSGGMQRRLGIARALALDPTLLFYDDPTAGLDPVISDRIVKLIQKLKEKFAATIVAVTNDIVSAFELADRIIMVAGHEAFEVGTVEDTKNSPDPKVQQFINGELEGPLKPLSI